MKIKEVTIKGSKCLIIYKAADEALDLQQLKEAHYCCKAAVFVSGTQDAEKILKEMLLSHNKCEVFQEV